MTTRSAAKAQKYQAELLAHAKSYPEAHVDHPWGETVVKIRKKIFVFLGMGTGGVGLSVKLPQSLHDALELPFCKPTGYGLGKAGWVSARFEEKDDVPLGLLESWIEESYRAVAPKTRTPRCQT